MCFVWLIFQMTAVSCDLIWSKKAHHRRKSHHIKVIYGSENQSLKNYKFSSLGVFFGGTVGPFALIPLVFSASLDKLWTYFILFVILLYFSDTFYGYFWSFWAVLEPFFDLFQFFKLSKFARKMSEIFAKWTTVWGIRINQECLESYLFDDIGIKKYFFY